MLIGRCPAQVISYSDRKLDRLVWTRSQLDRRRNNAVMSGAASVPLQLCCFTKRSDDDPALRTLIQGSLKGPPMQLVRCGISQRLGLSFDASIYFGALRTQFLGQVLLAAEEVPSTQTVVQENTAVLPNGTLCTATRQVAGKGRGGNAWVSPDGCLMFSLCLGLEVAGTLVPYVQYIVSMAIVQAVKLQTQQQLQGEQLDVRIKWPNDVYASGKKIAGVLTHSAYRNKVFRITVGCGINVANSEPSTCLDDLLRQQRPDAQPINKEVLLAGIMNRLERMVGILQHQGFEPLKQDYTGCWLHTDQQVVLEESKDGQTQKVPLRITGIGDQACLMACDEYGTMFELHPDGNSLDFFKGLVRRKAQ